MRIKHKLLFFGLFLLATITLLTLGAWRSYKAGEELDAARTLLIAKPFYSKPGVWNVDGIVMSTEEMIGCYRVQRAIMAQPELSDEVIIARLSPPRQVTRNFYGRCFYRESR
jgi:hypothetical protein